MGNLPRFTVEAEVMEQNGTCNFGHRVGDRVVFDGEAIRGRICWHALVSMVPKVHGFLFGADYPWLEERDTCTHACPDAFNPVVFRLRRVPRTHPEKRE
jgi:uncharacterized repeat protein (TIGR04076 family)